MVQEVIICDVDIMYFYSIINHTLSDPQWRASRADICGSDMTNTSQRSCSTEHTNNAHKRPRARLPGPWAARSLAAGRQAACRAATLLPVTPWPLRAALGPHQRMNEKAADCTKSSTAIAPVPRGRGINGVHVNKCVSAACGNFQ